MGCTKRLRIVQRKMLVAIFKIQRMMPICKNINLHIIVATRLVFDNFTLIFIVGISPVEDSPVKQSTCKFHRNIIGGKSQGRWIICHCYFRESG